MDELPAHVANFLIWHELPQNAWQRYASALAHGVTAPLKEWFSDHRQKPYPSKAEKMQLVIITKMTLNQVSGVSG